MSSEYTYSGIKGMRRRSRQRKDAIAEYLRTHERITERVAARAGVSPSMVSKVLHGHAVSRKVEESLFAEEASGTVAA